MPFNTLADDLQRLVDATDAIGQAIIDVGGTVNEYDRLEEYPADIKSINRNTTSIDITENGSYYAGEENTITTTAFPITIRNSVGTPMKHVTVDGNMQQNGTPTPQNPIQPNETGDRTGNILDFNKLKTAPSGTITSVGSFTFDHLLVIEVEPNTTYTMSATGTGSTSGDASANRSLYFCGVEGANAVFSGHDVTYTTSSEGKLYVGFISSRDNAQQYLNGTAVTAINAGSTALPYEPYGYKIPISNGDATTNVYLGEVPTTRKIKKLVLTGEEKDWGEYARADSSTVPYLPLSNFKGASITNIKADIICTHYETKSQVSIQNLTNKTGIAGRTSIGIIIADGSISTLADFKTYLAAQYAAGTPVTVWYVLAESTTTIVNEPIRKIGNYVDTVSADINLPLSSTEPNIIDIETSLKASSASFTYNIKNEYIGYNEINVDVPNTYTVADEGKVVSNGSLVSQTAKPTEITTNDTYDTITYNSVTVNVENSYTASDEGKVVSNGALVSQTTKPDTITSNNTYVTTLYNSVTVDVPNTYTQSDEGKVVNNGTLVAQTAMSKITSNNTYDTTMYNSVTVDVASEPQTQKDVNFYDYDGEIVKSYTTDEFANISALPSNPAHDGLTAQGWNWSLSDAKTYVAKYKKLNIGQMYVTTDGKTRIYITLTEGRISPILQLYLGSNSELDIDWGDGGSHSTFTNASTTAEYKSERHNYATAGDYIIAITVITGNFQLLSSSSNVSSLLWNGNNSQNTPDSAYNNSIKKVEIGTGTRYIGSNAFRNCYSLSSIAIPNTVSIGTGTFRNCYSLTFITIPNAFTGTIGGYIFQDCRSLSSIAIPNTVVTSITVSMFQNCYSLSSITIPDSVTTISFYAFQNCYSLTSFTIPDSVTTIDASIFQNCYSLSSITIPDSVTSIGSSIFNGCSSLSSIKIPNEVTSIGASAFRYCYSLSSITIPDSVTTIGNQAFSDCYSLSSVTIPDKVTSIGTFSFNYCSSLASVTIGTRVTTIDTYAFSDCSYMESIKFKPTTPPSVSNSNAWGNVPRSCIIYVPTGSLNAYKTATNYPNPSRYTYVEY